MTFQAISERGRLARFVWPRSDAHDTGRQLWFEHRSPVIVAQVVIKPTPFNALETVERHPFGKITSLVPEDRADREGDRGPAAERRGNASSDVGDPTPMLKDHMASRSNGG